MGYFSYDGLFYPCKTVRRAMQETTEACKSIGIQLVQIDMTEFKSLIPGIVKIAAVSSNIHDELMDGEPLMDAESPTKYLEMIPSSIKNVMCAILRKLGFRRECMFIENFNGPCLASLLEGRKLKQDFVDKFKQMYQELDLDGYIFPVMNLPAIKHFGTEDLAISVTVSIIANFLDSPACVIPVTKVSKDDFLEEYNDINYPNDHFVKCARNHLEGSEGLPVSVQVCTMEYEEEKCLGISKLIDDALKNKK
jgi:fatty acid amide hydrolase